MGRSWERLQKFLFPSDSGRWVAILRVGLGIEVALYAWSLRLDWSSLYGTKGYGLVNRALTEAVLSSQSRLTPRLGWLVFLGQHLGVGESTTLSLVWLGLLAAGSLLIIGLGCRFAAIAAWFLYLCSVKSGTLFTYGVDNFTTIGLFYLMIAPLPDAWSLDQVLRDRMPASPVRLGFQRRVLQLHLCIIYFFGGIAKALGPEWWNGTSVWRALTRPPFDLINPDLLIRFGLFLPFIGILVLLLETGYPIFIWPKKTRRWWLGAIVGMHLAIGLTMGLYLFALIMIVLNTAAFGPEYLLAMQKRLRSQRKRTIIPPPN